jgi:hypothetical protein
MIRLEYICNICGYKNTSTMDFYGISFTIHTPPLNRKIVLPEAKNAAAHICRSCVKAVKGLSKIPKI